MYMMAHLALLFLPLQVPVGVAALPRDGMTPEALAKKKQEEPAPKPSKDDLLRRPYDWDVQFSPDNDLYRTYLADPRQSKSGSKVQFPIKPSSDHGTKIENVLGGHRPIVGWTDPAHPDVEMQLQVEAAVFSRFDIDEGWDMDAADYRFGFPFLYRTGDVVLKVHPYHITSHMGDEFLSRVEGSERKSYHLDELAIGVSFPAAASWRVYFELGYGFYTGPETDAGRAQIGAEYIMEPISKRIAPFIAVDLQTRNEIDWNWNATAMIGLMMIPKEGVGTAHGLRGTLEYYRGSDSQTQFKEQREHFIAIGFAADF
jgi:hypothetical protein